MNVTLLDKVFADVIKLKGDYPELGWALNPKAVMLIRRPGEDTDTDTREGKKAT